MLETTVTTFLAPRVVLSGPGSAPGIVDRLAAIVGSEGQVLLAVDPVLRGHATIDAVAAGLRASGLAVFEQSDFGPDLTVEQVDSAAAAARDAGCIAVVGIGGGVVLDAAKLLAALLGGTPATSALDLAGALPASARRVPLVLIPTTVGTGSEVTRIAMVSSGARKVIVAGEVLIPDLAALDPNLVAALPPGVVGATGMDALAHAAESLMSSSRTPTTELLALAAIEIIRAHLEPAYGGDAGARAQMLHAAHLAGLALNAGVVIGHSLAYSVARLKPMSHGASCALALPYAIAYNQNMDRASAATLALALTGGSSDRLEDAAAEVKRLAAAVGQSTNLDEAGIPEGTEDELARICVDEYPRPTNPEPLTRSAVRRLASAMRRGDLDLAFVATAPERVAR